VRSSCITSNKRGDLRHYALMQALAFFLISVGSMTTATAEVGEPQVSNLELVSPLVNRSDGFTPWSNPLQMSTRYLTTLRAHTVEHKLSRVEGERFPSQAYRSDGLTDHVEVEVLDDFDRYILRRSKDRIQAQNDSPLFDSWVSLSHTWGHGSSGYLINARQMPKSPFWHQRRFKNYGTPEMIATIKAGIQALREQFPDAPPVILGDLSKRYGGHFPPHLSHQSGRDADIGYFMRGRYSHKLKGLTLVNRRTIDVEKTWAFLSGMLKTGLVESAFIDYQLQKVLYHHAKHEGKWSVKALNKVFSYPQWKGGVINHLKGHSDHMHMRFSAPLSEQAAVSYMNTHGHRRFRPRRVYTKPKKGESLVRLARRFRVNWKTLMRWNRLSKAQARRSLKRNRKYIVGYHTPYYARNIKFPLPEHRELLSEVLSHRH
jgi:murein endopeptidase